jgi:CheY-like chemotaxis protein
MGTEAPRVLVLVEDSADDELLSMCGIDHSGVSCEVKVIRHCGEAVLYLLDPTVAPPNLILMDFRLPGLNGVEVLRELRRQERTKRIPVVILSSANADDQLAECYDVGANSCVSKPLDPRLYLERVGMIIRYWLEVNDPCLV